MTIGIYKITNKSNNKVYIGESFNIERRWNEHKLDLENNSHHSYKLQNDYNIYGKNNFKFEVIEEVRIRNKLVIQKVYLLAFEDKYMKQFNSINNGYNVENTIESIVKENKPVFQDEPLHKIYVSMLIKLVNKIENEIIFNMYNDNYNEYKIFNNWLDNKNINSKELTVLIFLYTHYISNKSISICSFQMLIDIIRIDEVLQFKRIIKSLLKKNIIDIYDINNNKLKINSIKRDNLFYIKLIELKKDSYFKINKCDVDKIFIFLENTIIDKFNLFKYFITCKRYVDNKDKLNLIKKTENNNIIQEYDKILQNDLQLI